jgi:hypothetical protein
VKYATHVRRRRADGEAAQFLHATAGCGGRVGEESPLASRAGPPRWVGHAGWPKAAALATSTGEPRRPRARVNRAGCWPHRGTHTTTPSTGPVHTRRRSARKKRERCGEEGREEWERLTMTTNPSTTTARGAANQHNDSGELWEMDDAARRACWRGWATPVAKEEGERGKWVQEPVWAVFWRRGRKESGVLEKKTCGGGCSGWHTRREGRARPIWPGGLGRATPERLVGRGTGAPGGPCGKRARAGWAAAAAGS